jgi:uncharacterized protein (TIGR04141 family)
VPDWVDFLAETSANALPDIKNQLSAAVIIVRRQDRLWGMTFGLGHLFINEDRVETRFGLRTVLNIVDPKLLLSVGSRVHDELIMRTVRQASRSTRRGSFTIDDTRDIVGSVTGTPTNKAEWGTRLTGSSALSLTVPVSSRSVTGLLDRLQAAHDKDDYKAEFGFIDFIEPVRDRALVGRLDAELVLAVRGDVASDVYLAPPEVVDYEDVRGFLFSGERIGNEHPELDLADVWDSHDSATVSRTFLDDLDVRVVAESTGHERKRWSLYKCLIHEVSVEGHTYLLSEGEWFEVSPTFIDRVNTEIAQIPVVDLQLPPAFEGEKEGDWNRRAATTCDYALLDQREIRFGGTDMEVADLLTRDRHLVHVKRKTASATLSHLLNQGRVSAEALKVDATAREAAAQQLDALGRAEAGLLRTGFDTRAFTVAYAVIAKNAADLPGKLPFFSRLNLWHARRFLAGTLDYQVAFARVPIVPR